MAWFSVVDWITPGSLVLSLRGTLDEAACRSVEGRMRQLLVECPGIRLTLDLAGVEAVDRTAVENLFLAIVANRVRGGSLLLACPSLACLPVLRQLNMDYLGALPVENPLVGATA